jgi:hypothetical protein
MRDTPLLMRVLSQSKKPKSLFLITGLIPLVLRLVESVSVGEEIVGIQRAIAQILVQQAVYLICTTLGGDHYRRSRAAPVLGRVGIGDDFEFLNIVYGGPHSLRA